MRREDECDDLPPTDQCPVDGHRCERPEDRAAWIRSWGPSRKDRQVGHLAPHATSPPPSHAHEQRRRDDLEGRISKDLRRASLQEVLAFAACEGRPKGAAKAAVSRRLVLHRVREACVDCMGLWRLQSANQVGRRIASRPLLMWVSRGRDRGGRAVDRCVQIWSSWVGRRVRRQVEGKERLEWAPSRVVGAGAAGALRAVFDGDPSQTVAFVRGQARLSARGLARLEL